MPEDSAAVARAMASVLRKRADAMGLTQDQVAVRAGIDQSGVSRIFAHKAKLSFQAAVALCAALEIGLVEAYEEATLAAREADPSK